MSNRRSQDPTLQRSFMIRKFEQMNKSLCTLTEVMTNLTLELENNNITKICKCDDINGDGTDIRNYYEVYATVVSNNTLSSQFMGIYTDESLQTNYTPTNPIDCEDIGSPVLDTIKQCMVDDVNGDGTNLVPYVRYLALKFDGTSDVLVNFNASLTGPYYPANPTDPCDVGLPATGKSGKLIIEPGSNWSPSSLVQSYTIRVEGSTAASDVDTYLNGATYTDSFGVTTPLADSETSTWSWSGVESDGVPVATPGNKKLIITYTTL